MGPRKACLRLVVRVRGRIMGCCRWALPPDAGATARATSAGRCGAGPLLGEFSDHASVVTCTLLGDLN